MENNNYIKLNSVLSEVRDERLFQDKKWGEQNWPCLDNTLLQREGGCTPQRMVEEYELPTATRAKYLVDSKADDSTLTYAHIALEEFCEVVEEFDSSKRRQELIQLAAVCVAWVEKIDRDNSSKE